MGIHHKQFWPQSGSAPRPSGQERIKDATGRNTPSAQPIMPLALRATGIWREMPAILKHGKKLSNRQTEPPQELEREYVEYYMNYFRKLLFAPNHSTIRLTYVDSCWLAQAWKQRFASESDCAQTRSFPLPHPYRRCGIQPPANLRPGW